jgi:hypothetical protein
VFSTDYRRSSLRQSDLYHYRITYEDPAGETQLFLFHTDDKLEAGGVVEDKGRLIEIKSLEAHPYRGVITPLHGHLR